VPLQVCRRRPLHLLRPRRHPPAKARHRQGPAALPRQLPPENSVKPGGGTTGPARLERRGLQSAGLIVPPPPRSTPSAFPAQTVSALFPLCVFCASCGY
jgi:hypothetical protein